MIYNSYNRPSSCHLHKLTWMMIRGGEWEGGGGGGGRLWGLSLFYFFAELSFINNNELEQDNKNWKFSDVTNFHVLKCFLIMNLQLRNLVKSLQFKQLVYLKLRLIT